MACMKGGDLPRERTKAYMQTQTQVWVSSRLPIVLPNPMVARRGATSPSSGIILAHSRVVIWRTDHSRRAASSSRPGHRLLRSPKFLVRLRGLRVRDSRV
jgi:hypothetical protein